MSSTTPETNVDAGALPSGPDSGFALDIEEKSISDAFTGWIGKLRTGDPGPCRRSSASSSWPSSSARSATGSCPP